MGGNEVTPEAVPRVILSPHIDDAVLSLGGYILLCRDRGIPVYVINIFTESDFDATGSRDVEKISQARRWEEERIAALAGYTLFDLKMKDSPVRGYKINSRMHVGDGILPSVFAASVNDEQETIDEVTQAVLKTLGEIGCETSEIKVLGPTGIGCHRDHMITHRALWNLARTGKVREFAYYEDQPYAAAANITKVGLLDLLHKPIFFEWGGKEELIRMYESQPVVEWIPPIKDYARKMALKEKRVEGHCEMIWMPHILKQ